MSVARGGAARKSPKSLDVARTWCVVLFVSAIVVSLGHAPSGARASVPPPATSAPATSAPVTPAPSATAAPTGTPDPTTLPPAGIAPTAKTLAQVLALYAAGEGKPIPAKTKRETDAITAYGETGTYVEAESGDDYVTTTRIGPTTFASGSYRGQAWRRDENGYTRLVGGVHRETEVSAQAFKGAVAGPGIDGVTLLGEVAKPVHAYVVQVAPPGGRLEWMFIDPATGDIVRTEVSYEGVRDVYTYGDFRKTAGVDVPWHEHYSDGRAEDEFDWKTTSLDLDARISPGELAIPPSRSLVRFPQGVTAADIPAVFDYGAVVVHVVIGGRGLDLELDSGSSDIVLDADVASQLGLKTFHTQGDTFSKTSESSSAIVPEMKIGPLTMDGVVVNCLPFFYNPDDEHKVVGLIGYDFLAGVVVKIDYVHHAVEAFDPTAFPKPAGETIDLPVKLDDQVPEVSAQLGEGDPGTFIIDTGSQFFLLFQSFADAHRNDLARVGYAYDGKVYYPKETAEGVGGFFSVQAMHARDFFIGGEGFADVSLDESSAFKTEDLAGLIGYPILQYFDVYLDYPDSTVMLQPNSVLTDMSK